MSGQNRWIENAVGKVRKNLLMRVKMTLTAKATNSGASAVVGDYYEFDCTSKTLPSPADSPTWTEVTDNPNEPTGYAYVGKSEQLENIELVAPTYLKLVYDELLEHKMAGDVFTVVFTYDDPLETSVVTVSVASCQIIGVKTDGGENNAKPTTTITLLPEGGKAENMPAITLTNRA